MDNVTSPNAGIDTKLSEALKHWSDYASESPQNLQALFGSFNPLKDNVQIVQHMLQALYLGWTPASLGRMNPAALTDACRELAELQRAAQDKGTDCCQRFLNTTLSVGQQIAESVQGATSPQDFLGSYLDASLGILRQYEYNARAQATAFGKIQSAYRAWLQKTLENLYAQPMAETGATSSLPAPTSTQDKSGSA